jgi:hypothetical protein
MPINVPADIQRLIDINIKRRIDFQIDPSIFYPWWRRCHVKTLLVTDGGLDFSQGDFGLSLFVDILQHDSPSYVHFDLTLAHLGNGNVMSGAAGIVRSINNFRFDEPSHFTADMYDQVWLFGIETQYQIAAYPSRLGNPSRYPNDRLGDGELDALHAHMNRGGGVFATGDHGALGRGLCGSVARVRSMRHWDSFTLPGSSQDEVSMSGPKRNDTNQIGHDASLSTFSDQSDDVPQTIDLKLYRTRIGALRNARYPHPVLCGRTGRIDVLPDHPHEGECREPTSAELAGTYRGFREYPDRAGGGGAPSPEVIATSRVPSGNTALNRFGGTKQATVAHTFGAISAYNGHPASVGRIICDATWHHFINVNLAGVVEGGGFDQFGQLGNQEDASKHDGFLTPGSVQGLAAISKIKNYFTNIGVWIASPEAHRCFHRRHWWQLLYKERIMEASLVDPAVKFDRIPIDTFFAIGIHARDVLGHLASQCQSIEWVLDWIKVVWPEIVLWVDPWDPIQNLEEEKVLPLPIIDPMPLLDVALGGALVAMRQAFPYPPAKGEVEELGEKARAVAMEGARMALQIASKQSGGLLAEFIKLSSLAGDAR